ncbi:hypothetical protein [Heyndrickxia acidiproducens]|uniref:hypothetical protein n=1 Tax=Heyndrickxia acidiproducens TaxID=1121084 RepID=UPI000371BA00|nr:hypothetical protein [Heyndrickxia acidiproducens]
MEKEVNQNVILQAILELSQQMKSMEQNLSGRIDSLEEGQKEIREQVRKIDKKLEILNKELLDTRADVEILKRAK